MNKKMEKEKINVVTIDLGYFIGKHIWVTLKTGFYVQGHLEKIEKYQPIKHKRTKECLLIFREGMCIRESDIIPSSISLCTSVDKSVAVRKIKQ